MLADVNLFAVAVSGVIFFVLGGLWYAAVLSKPWHRGLALSPEQKDAQERNFPVALSAHFACGLIASFILANIIVWSGATTFAEGLYIGALIWLGFAFTLNLISLMFERRATSTFLINASFYLVAFGLIGGILALWR